MKLRLPWWTSHEWQSFAGLVFLLVLFACAIATDQPLQVTDSVQLQPLPDAALGKARISADGEALLIPGGEREQVAQLHFSLPSAQDHGSGWAIWMERNPVDTVQLRRGDWQSVERRFYRPDPAMGQMPTGFAIPLPGEWRGDIVLELHARGDLRTALRPKLVSSQELLRIERKGIATGAMIYASLFTLAFLSLALFSAAHDRLFLGLFGNTLLTLLTLGAINGHLYLVSGFRWLGNWGAQGLLAIGCLLCASTLQMLLHYTGERQQGTTAARVVDVICAVLVALAVLCLLDLRILLPWLQSLAMLAWVSTAVIALVLILMAIRRRVPMAWPLALLATTTAVALAVWELALLGRPVAYGWVHSGYQVALAAFMAVFAVGLISRISEYRDQRDRDWLARMESEQRMQREAARSELNAALQLKLRACSEDDIEWTAFRLLLDHLMPLVRVKSAMVMAHGYHGQNVQVVVPVARKAEVKEKTDRRELALKRHAANGIPLQQPVIVSGGAGQVAMEALIPLSIRAPAWGLLLLERTGGEGFTTDEMALAGEFARLTLGQIDQALSAILLRRSAELDALTGVFNRRTIDQWLARSFSDAQRDDQPISVLFVDLDHFKSINDRHGHACGDLCLNKVAATLRSALGEDDLFGRYGGEEFIAVLPGRGGAAARAAGEQLRAGVERLAVEWEGQALQLTVSVGVATRLPHETKPAETIDRADKALYDAKRGGRNCVYVAPAVFS